TDNVVNYTAVVSVDNSTGALLPGMTATLQFTTASADDVYTVPNAALRFRPTEQQLADAGITLPQAGAGRDPTQRRQRSGSAGASAVANDASRARGGATGRAGSRGQIWYLDAKGKLAVARVKTGISDGSRIVVEGSDLLQPGMRIIIGSATANAA